MSSFAGLKGTARYITMHRFVSSCTRGKDVHCAFAAVSYISGKLLGRACLVILGLMICLTGGLSASAAVTTATAVANVQGGLVVSFTVTSGGSGYTKPPEVNLTGGGGTGASATALVEDGKVVRILVRRPGRGYTSAPAVTIDPPEIAAIARFELKTVLAQRVPVLTLNGETGAPYVIQVTTNLGNSSWRTVSNLVLTAPQFEFFDNEPASANAKFYRAINLAGRPPSGLTNPHPDRLVWIPAGTFLMGSPPGELDRVDDEGPQTRVTIARGFWMGKYEVTQAEYLAIMGENPSIWRKSTNNPVDNVSWDDAVLYCTRRTEEERAAGRIPATASYRLPTEAEWEYACRAQMTTRYSFGDDVTYTQIQEYAWFNLSGVSGSQPVGLKKPNAWGLHDMHGNVWEYCSDWYGTYPGGFSVDMRGPSVGEFKVIRGGTVGRHAMLSRSASREGRRLNFAASNLGFRVVLDPGAL